MLYSSQKTVGENPYCFKMTRMLTSIQGSYSNFAREKSNKKKSQNHGKKALFAENYTFLTQLLNINEFFSNDYCEIFLI